MRVSLLIPAYNEAERIVRTLETVRAFFAAHPEYDPEVLLVSDGSTDATVEQAEAHAAGDPSVRIIAYQPNRGKGYAVRRGMIEATGDVRVLCDADLSTPITDLPRFIAFHNGGRRIVVASRALPSSELGGWRPGHRQYGGIAFNRLVQAVLVPGCWDTQCGFKLFAGDAAEAIFGRCLCDGFAYDVEALAIARHLGYEILELGVCWDNSPDTKVRVLRDMMRAVRDLGGIALRRRRGYYDAPIGDV